MTFDFSFEVRVEMVMAGYFKPREQGYRVSDVNKRARLRYRKGRDD